MGKKGHFDYQYNAQISVDGDTPIIVGQQLSQNATDKKEVKPALEHLQETTGTLPDQLSADNGYFSGDNLEVLEESGVDASLATDNGEKKNKVPVDDAERKLTKADFEYHGTDNTFTCPGGPVLEMKPATQDGKRVYQGDAAAGAGCVYQKRCGQSRQGAARTISPDNNEPLRQQLNAKMEADASKALYKKRKVIVEPVFGQIKNSGFQGFSVRGKDKTAGEFSLVCATPNFKKIARSIIKGVVCPAFGKLATHPA